VNRILFESGRTKITPQGKKILKKVGDILKNVEGKRIQVVGHTDNKPILPEYRYRIPSNWELSAFRAAAVVRFLQKNIGIGTSNFELVGRSFYEPIASNETEKGRARNRRVNIILAP
jgi:chemotaxis protein MotB